ncbi:hypothetical protein [uncultured Helicobacter sp.]|nr:hypothetical protein [uncultured Helicobacter sp.]
MFAPAVFWQCYIFMLVGDVDSGSELICKSCVDGDFYHKAYDG